MKKNTDDPLDGLSTTSGKEPTQESDERLEALKVGSVFAGRYEILSKGKRGGMGVVFKVKDITLDKDCALKVIHPSLATEEAAIQRFKQEVTTSRDLRHPNIVNVYDFGESGGIQYFTMEWIDGVTLRVIINKRRALRKPFDLEETRAMVSELSSALDYAHRYTIHRDVKPENILVNRDIDSGKLTLKLVDFGIAKMLSPSRLGADSQQLGTFNYMAPEQKEDPARVDKRADIYSTGVILFELLTLENTMRLESASEINKALPKEIDAVIKKAVKAEPGNRYGEVRELTEALDLVIRKMKEVGKDSGTGNIAQDDTSQRETEEAERQKREDEKRRAAEEKKRPEIEAIRAQERRKTEELEKQQKERLQGEAGGEKRRIDEGRNRRRKFTFISIGSAAVLCLIIVAYLGLGSGGRTLPPGADIKPAEGPGKASPAPLKTVSSKSKEPMKEKSPETKTTFVPQGNSSPPTGPAPSTGPTIVAQEPPKQAPPIRNAEGEKHPEANTASAPQTAGLPPTGLAIPIGISKVAQGPPGQSQPAQPSGPVNPPVTVHPKDDRKEIGKPAPDDEKRSAIVEANGYALVSKEKSIKELQQEAYSEARRQAAESARNYVQQLTQTRGIKVAFKVTESHGQVEVLVLEQKDFGIQEGKHYHVWIKAEVQYTIGKTTTDPINALSNPQAPLTVRVWTDKKKYQEGDELKIYLQGNKTYYARIIYVDASGTIVQLLPNAYRTQNFFQSGKTYVVPDEEDRFKLEIEPPFGQEKIIVYASPNPLGDIAMERLDKGLYGYRGNIQTLAARSRGIGIKPTEPSKPSATGAEFYEALWQVQTGK